MAQASVVWSYLTILSFKLGRYIRKAYACDCSHCARKLTALTTNAFLYPCIASGNLRSWISSFKIPSTARRWNMIFRGSSQPSFTPQILPKNFRKSHSSPLGLFAYSSEISWKSRSLGVVIGYGRLDCLAKPFCRSARFFACSTEAVKALCSGRNTAVWLLFEMFYWKYRCPAESQRGAKVFKIFQSAPEL